MQLLKAAEKPEAVLRNMIVPPVEIAGAGDRLSLAVICPHWVPQVRVPTNGSLFLGGDPILGPGMLLIQCR